MRHARRDILGFRSDTLARSFSPRFCLHDRSCLVWRAKPEFTESSRNTPMHSPCLVVRGCKRSAPATEARSEEVSRFMCKGIGRADRQDSSSSETVGGADRLPSKENRFRVVVTCDSRGIKGPMIASISEVKERVVA